ncbi:MFS transporter [Variovorax sp. R-27]|jgi:MFS family permease|uniref:MFS transporter n=1 Tax=Variovorax sp. R-27 TaxID=3404058 RepID=UPI003CE94E87
MTPCTATQTKDAAGDHVAPWDTRYEFKAIGLLTIGYGLVGLDRFIINPLFPVMQKDLGLDYQDMGLISASLALAWGTAALFSGGLADRVGRKNVLVPALLAFSLLVATSGLAVGLLSLLLVRALMGLAEGAYTPASVVATVAASNPSRVGLNVGIQQMAQPLVGLGLGPLIAIGLLKVLPSWHWVFAAVGIPGLALALLMARVLRKDAPATRPAVERGFSARPPGARAALRYPAVLVAGLCMVCYLGGLITLATFLPSYLTDHLGLPLETMGMVMAGQGLGSLVGMVVVPAFSDRAGRKPALIAALVVGVVALGVFTVTSPQPVILFLLLFIALGSTSGAIAITLGPLTSAAVPATLATSATGVVVGMGEILGGALAPALAGWAAKQAGIAIIPHLGLAALMTGLVLVLLCVRESGTISRATTGMPVRPED